MTIKHQWHTECRLHCTSAVLLQIVAGNRWKLVKVHILLHLCCWPAGSATLWYNTSLQHICPHMTGLPASHFDNGCQRQHVNGVILGTLLSATANRTGRWDYRRCVAGIASYWHVGLFLCFLAASRLPFPRRWRSTFLFNLFRIRVWLCFCISNLSLGSVWLCLTLWSTQQGISTSGIIFKSDKFMFLVPSFCLGFFGSQKVLILHLKLVIIEIYWIYSDLDKGRRLVTEALTNSSIYYSGCELDSRTSWRHTAGQSLATHISNTLLVSNLWLFCINFASLNEENLSGKTDSFSLSSP